MPVGNRRFKNRDYESDSLVERRGGVQRFRWYDGVWQRIESLDDLIWHHLTDMGFITPIREILRTLELRIRAITNPNSILGKRKRDNL